MRTCRDGCQPAYCQSGTGRSEPSFGRRKREINATLELESNNTISGESLENSSEITVVSVSFPKTTTTSSPINVTSANRIKKENKESEEDENEEEYVREMIEVIIS